MRTDLGDGRKDHMIQYQDSPLWGPYVVPPSDKTPADAVPLPGEMEPSAAPFAPEGPPPPPVLSYDNYQWMILL